MFGADFQTSTKKQFSALEASASRVLDAVPENIDIMWIFSQRTLDVTEDTD